MPFRKALGGNSYFVYRRQGPLGRISNSIPLPLKAFAGVAGLAAATVILAPAILILATPPLICGAWLIHRRRKAFEQLAEQLHHQRWQDLASFHLQPAAASDRPERIPTFARIAVEAALQTNDQDLRSKLGPGTVSFSGLEALSQDFSAASHGFAEKMSVAQYVLFVGDSPAATVRVVQRQGLGQDPRSSARSRVELQLKDGSLVILKGGSPDDIIEGHGHRIR